MCGIAGVLHFDVDRVVDESVLRGMTNTLRHRGPDGEGYYIDQNVGLGHRRLSIIDLATGDQPQFNTDRSIAIVFNGEIYNYVELREELIENGYSFTTTSDTEVIIRAYEKWGIECQEKFNGMWAFAIWDERKRQLFISRDRLGEKPLFYSYYDNSIIFGSEIKSLLKYGIPVRPNLELTELYLTLSCIPAPYTFYKGVQKLRPGHCIVATPEGYVERKYWDLPELDEADLMKDKFQVYKTFEELLFNSVKIRMRSDVSFGAFLSGGLDSSSIVAVMSEVSTSPVQTFTIGFKEKFFDERRLARMIAERYVTEHNELQIEPDSFDESIGLTLRHFDEPFGDSSSIATGMVSRIAAKRVKMVLTGDGGDEVLSGYTPYQAEKFAVTYQRLPKPFRTYLPKVLDLIAQGFRGNLRYRLNRSARVLASSNLTFEDRLKSKMWCDPRDVRELVVDAGNQIKIDDFLDEFYSSYQVDDPFYRLMYFHLKVILPDDYLTKVDRMSMANSLETRVPFLDHRIVEFMATVHKDVKMQGYIRKSVLRNVMAKRLPGALLKAPKKGFGVPLREWFKDDAFQGRLDLLASSDIGLNRSLVKKMIADNNSGKRDLGNFLWMLLVYREWIYRAS